MDRNVTVDGVRIGWSVTGPADRPVVVLMPVGAIVDAQHWKAQVPYLSRHFRVVTYDAPGNGHSDRPEEPGPYADTAQVAQLLAVLDAAGAPEATLVGLCRGAWRALVAAAWHPERVTRVVAIAPAAPGLTPPRPERAVHPFHGVLDTDAGWAKFNADFWRRDYPAFARFFFETVISEPHSTKQREDAIGWALQTTPAAMTAAESAERVPATPDLLRRVRCEVLVIRGTGERCLPVEQQAGVARLTGAREVVLDGADHMPHARRPVRVNRLIRDFVDPRPAPAPRRRPGERVLFLSSPIGLGHVERDLAIVAKLRELRPGVRVDWLAQHPITEVLRRRGERVHPASRHLAAEAAHVDAEAGVHDLHAFRAIRRMDAILVANFMLFADLVERERYDLWAGDEAWELDHFLHENPELKRAPYAWLTDFVGWLPTPAGGAAEAALTADYNAEMVAHVAAHPRLRDRSIFVGNPDDLVDDPLGPGLPTIREWTLAHFDCTGYAGPPIGPRPAAEPLLCVATAGGSGVGEALLRRVADAFPIARRAQPGLRMVLVTGPRIDHTDWPRHDGLEVRGHVDRLDTLLARCDLGITHGGLTTTMTLTAYRRPFLYVPLRNHFEQNRHVRHRLAAYRAGRCLDWDTLTPQSLAAAMVEEVGRPVDYRPVETDGADRAAALLAEVF